jgi:nucleoside-diphosphate-sugar epimerase
MQDLSHDPLDAYRSVNVKGTARLAQQAVRAGVRRLIYMSSVKVNGEESPMAYSENDRPSPQDAYAISKWEAEQLLQQLAADTGLEVVIIRPPLVYGPGVRANFMQLISIVNRRIPLPLAGVNNRRSLIYIENLVDAIISCVSRPEAVGQTYLVSDGTDVSSPELIRRIAEALGKKAILLPCPINAMRWISKLIGKSVEVERLLGSLTVDPSKIQRQLGWHAPYSMDQGLRKTAEWFLNKSAASSGIKGYIN